ncbi:MAG: Ig-like domain-containing protein, partial [bacterium]
MRALRLVLAVVAVLVVGCPKKAGEAARPGRPIAMPEFTEAELAAAPALGVAAATPQGQLDEASAADEVAVTFDAPMIALGEETDSSAFPLLLDPDVAGRCRWLGDRTIVFAPDSGFAPATRYSVRIPRGVRAAEGEMLKSDYRFEFLTVRPQLARSEPYDGQEYVELDRPLWLMFNLPMDPKRAARGISLRGPAGLDVAVRLRHPRPGETPEESWWYDSSQASRILVVEPRRRLAIESPYALRLSPELRAAQGDLGMANARVVAFRTFNRLRLEGIVDAGAHYPEDVVELVFSNPVPVAMVARDIQFIPPVKMPEEYRNGDWATRFVRLSVPLNAETQYEVRLSRWVSDKFGNRLGRAQKLKLRTVSYRPRASMPTGPGVIESEGKPFHPVTMVNIESLAVRTRRLGVDEVVPYWRAVY